MQLWPWEYLFEPFNQASFPDLYIPLTIASLAALIATVIFYNVRTRQLHRHSIYLQMYEWLLWTGIVVFGLMLVYFVFNFDWIIVLATLLVGPGHDGLDPVRPLPAVLPRVRAPAREAALLLARPVLAPRVDDQGEVRPPTAPPPLARIPVPIETAGR